nr:conotoxin precursor Ggeo01 [Conus judaeus]
MSRLFLVLLVISVITVWTTAFRDGDGGTDKRSGQLSHAIEDGANDGSSWKHRDTTKFRRFRRGLSDHTIEKKNEGMNGIFKGLTS